MYDWSCDGYSPDYSDDLYDVGLYKGDNIVYDDDDEVFAYRVPDLKGVIEYARDWENYETDYDEPETRQADENAGIERVVEIVEI